MFYFLPRETSSVSCKSVKVVRSLLEMDPEKRLTCEQALAELCSIPVPNELQIVPVVGEDSKVPEKPSTSSAEQGKSGQLVITTFKEEAKALTYRELKKLYSAIQSKDGNLKKVLKRL